VADAREWPGSTSGLTLVMTGAQMLKAPQDEAHRLKRKLKGCFSIQNRPINPATSRFASANSSHRNTMGYQFRRDFSLAEGAARGTCGHLVPGGRAQHGFVAEHHGCSNTSPTRRVAPS